MAILTDAWKQPGGKAWAAAFIMAMCIPFLLIVHRTAADSFTVFIGLLFLWQSFRTRDWSWTADFALRAAFFAWLWTVLVVSPFAYTTNGSFGISLPWIRYILLYAALSHWVLVRREPFSLFACVLALLLGFVIIDTLWQYLLGMSITGHPMAFNGRLTGPFTNIKVGLYLGKMLIPVAGLCIYFTHQRIGLLLASFLLLLAGIATIMLAGERTAFISTTFGVLLIIGMVAGTEPRLRPYCIGGFVLLLLLLTLLFYSQSWVQYRAHLMYETLRDLAYSSYGQLFKAGYLLGMEHWLTGTGFKGFREMCPSLIEANRIRMCDLHPHNPYIAWFVATGAVGLALFILLVFGLLRSAFRSFRQVFGMARLLPAVAIGTWLVHFMPFMPTQNIFSNWPAILLWYSLGVGYAAINLTRERA